MRVRRRQQIQTRRTPMYVKPKQRFHLGFVLLVVASLNAGCVSKAETAPTVSSDTSTKTGHTPLHINFAIDTSSSVCAQQRQIQLGNAQKLLSKIGANDTVE